MLSRKQKWRHMKYGPSFNDRINIARSQPIPLLSGREQLDTRMMSDSDESSIIDSSAGSSDSQPHFVNNFIQPALDDFNDITAPLETIETGFQNSQGSCNSLLDSADDMETDPITFGWQDFSDSDTLSDTGMFTPFAYIMSTDFLDSMQSNSSDTSPTNISWDEDTSDPLGLSAQEVYNVLNNLTGDDSESNIQEGKFHK